ncbi:MAG: histidine kinase [Acidobacteria bacterium]|nr:histidine kinase [Acidobacteriota bacterium]
MTPRRMAWRFAVLFWTLFGVVTGIQVWISMITHGHSVPRLIFYYVAISEGWLAATVGIVWLARRFPIVPLRRLPILVHFLAACVIAVLHSFYWLGLLIAIRPYDRMTAEPAQMPIASILFFRVPLEFLLYCMVLGAAMAFDFYERYRERALQAAQLETSLADARLHALELQIQPHFLFNTLNAISGLVRVKRNDEAITMLAGLSELLRYTLDHENDQRVPLDVELAVLRRYLEIQRARFPDRMSFTIDASSEAGRGAVPTLLLQPLAENAIRHGIELSASPGVVNVRAFRNNGHLHIEVFNTGTLGERSESGIGVRNTLDRLRHLYGEEARFDLKSAGEGVLASVSIPWSSL